MSTMSNDRPIVKLDGWDPAISRFLAGIPELRIPPVPVDDDQGDDEWAPHDAWRWELGPEPTDDDRAWHARQGSEGGTVEGESDRSDIAGWTLDAWTYRLEQMESESEAQDRLDNGIDGW